MAGRLDGKVAVVTGASSGISEATVRTLCAEGAAVVAGARRKERLDGLVEEVKTRDGGRVIAVECDVTDEKQAHELVPRAVEEFGRIDILVSIHTAADGEAPMHDTCEVRAAAERGLEGDRYYENGGYYFDHPGPIREVSLIEEETVETLERDHGMEVAPGKTRRNVVTRGVSPNHLVKREFRVGEAALEGVEPCDHLVAVTGERSLLHNLIHRGGLHARVVKSGKISRGDTLEAVRTGEAT